MTPELKLVRLKARRQFLYLAKQGQKVPRKTLVLQALPFNEAEQIKAKLLARQPGAYSAAFVGFTASKKVGNAVARNRAKRRLAAAVRLLLPSLAQPGQAYVFIARGTSVDAPYAQIEQDLVTAIQIAQKKMNHD